MSNLPVDVGIGYRWVLTVWNLNIVNESVRYSRETSIFQKKKTNFSDHHEIGKSEVFRRQKHTNGNEKIQRSSLRGVLVYLA